MGRKLEQRMLESDLPQSYPPAQSSTLRPPRPSRPAETSACPRFANQSRQTLRAAPSGHHAQSCAAMAKDSIRCGNAIVARQRQVHASAHAVAANGGNHRNGKPVNGQHERLPCMRKLQGLRPGEPQNFVEVGAGRKEFFIAGDDERFELAASASKRSCWTASCKAAMQAGVSLLVPSGEIS